MKKYLSTALLFGLLMVVAVCGGLYIGAMLYTEWLGLKTEPSVSLLIKYWQHIEQLPENMILWLYVSSIAAAILPVFVLVVVLTTVFSRPQKELHGSARFANLREIKKTGLLRNDFEDSDPPDLLVGKYQGEYLRWANDGFVYLAARTRGGKGVGFVVPNCLHYRHSMAVNDPKKENFLITAGFRARCGHKVFFFNPSGTMPYHDRDPSAPLISHRWNPLTYVRRNPINTYKDALAVAAVFYPLPTEDRGSVKFFQQEAQKLFVGLLLYMIETEKERDLSKIENKTTMANLFRLTTPTDGKTLQEWIRAEFELRAAQPETTQLSSNCKTLLMGFANGNAKTSGDVLSTMTAPLAIFLDPAVEAATGGDDFYLDNVCRKLTTIYLGISPEEIKVYGTLLNLFFSQLCDVNVRQGLPKDNKDLKYQCLLMLDEFTALGRIPAIEEGVGYLAGYGIRPTIVFQTPGQVEKVYGRTGRQTFFSNFTCRLVFAPREQDEAEELSKLIGYYTYKAKSSSRSRGKNSSSSSNSVSDQKRAVMNPDELKIMPDSDVIINMTGIRPIYADKIIYHEDPILCERANLPVPHVPELQVTLTRKQPPQVVTPDYVSPEDMASFKWGDAANSDEIARALLTSLVKPDSPPDFVEKIVPVIIQNWGEGRFGIVSEILKNTSTGSNNQQPPKAA
ncbi:MULTISPECIES: type IV secretory system conjugative DNA transfer family protein [unclassified Neisseria]|uniref:type IV secretory system conjugative DNA transfer family protein n=1 Tax=unclassified Neisseria TaxID=2623750 RepID=UPI002666ECA2|nr:MULTISPECIES: type IV secretory system conjugative DNA transfer family protein [unclassified Neisseria]MDO1509536.1 type IV secretory system conjugative DNA transfer family protein [Neisseria sp. MVDL19-042950]MDO1515692.1 type IV secretory system conjugative DNA transfer family protein [Neisseria sp. MVDL18-041461]MDO1563484.1 type IV secretory system conjugative DNA transfer family protein [Neisseria sp. MVDL20-010259]